MPKEAESPDCAETKSGNVAENCRKYEIAPTLYYRWKDEGHWRLRQLSGSESGVLSAPDFSLSSHTISCCLSQTR